MKYTPIKRDMEIPQPDGSIIHVVEYLPDGVPFTEVKTVLQYIPGSFEHAEMSHIKALAQHMVAEYGYAVIIPENPGHGLSTNTAGVPYYFEGIEVVVENHRQVCQMLREKYPNAKIACVGFSFGSVVSKMAIMKYPNLFDGAALLGSSHQNQIEVNIAILIAKLAAKLAGGYDKPSALIDKLTDYGPDLAKKLSKQQNKKITAEGPFFWICSHVIGREAFEREVLGDGRMRVGMFASMMDGMKFTAIQENINQIPEGFKIFFGSGEMDPAGNYCHGVFEAQQAFEKAGADVTVCIYKGCFHAILAEECAQEVYANLGKWAKELGR